jgi:CheY-like chemotaxis protein
MPASLRILVIEDDADDIDFLTDAFAENGVQVKLETLTRGDLINKYLESVREFPDLIVMDLNLPKLHGRDVLCRIRDDKRFDKIPLAVLTTSSLEEDRTYCMEHGANQFISKPSSPEGFTRLIQKLTGMVKPAGK